VCGLCMGLIVYMWVCVYVCVVWYVLGMFYLLHSMSHYTVILHALHNLRFN